MNSSQTMSKRVGLTLPDTIHDKLERWAKSEGRPIANLCNFLLEKAVREAEDKGEIPPAQDTTDKPTK